MPSSPPSPSRSGTADRRPGPFSLIEFGNLVSAALALDNNPANRFSESLLQFDPDLNVIPSSSHFHAVEPEDASAHAKSADDDEEGSREFEIKPTRSLQPSESAPPSSPMIQASSTQANAQNVKPKLRISPTRTRKLLDKIKRKAAHILRPSTSTSASTPVLDPKAVQPEPSPESDPGPNAEPELEPELEYGPELVDEEEPSSPPTPIPTVDLPSSFYKDRGESISKDEVFVPFLPLVVQYERDRNKATPKRLSSPDGMSIFSRASSCVTRPTEAGSRPASAVVSDPAATTLDPDAAYHHVTDESDASTHRWSVHTSDYGPSVPSCYSSKTDESQVIVGASSLGRKGSQDLSLSGSRDTHTYSVGGDDLPSTPTYVAAGPSTYQQQHPDWTLSLPLDAPLDVIYPPSASSSTRSDSSYLSGSYTHASSAASTRSKGGAKGKERAYALRLSEAVFQHPDHFPHHHATSSTLATIGSGESSRSSWASPTPCPSKPLPQMPVSIDPRMSEDEHCSGSGSGMEGNVGSGKAEVRRGSLEDRHGISSPEPSPTSTFSVIQPEAGFSDAETNAEGDEVGTLEEDVIVLKSVMREGSGDQESTTGTLYYQCREVDNEGHLA